MLDFENESNRNIVEFFRAELIQVLQGNKIDHRTRIKLSRKGLIRQPTRNAKYQLTNLAYKLLEEDSP